MRLDLTVLAASPEPMHIGWITDEKFAGAAERRWTQCRK
jgi:hypothetical protein